MKLLSHWDKGCIFRYNNLNKQKFSKMENILEEFTPEMITFYNISIHEDKMLCIGFPNFIGINLANIVSIQGLEDTIKVSSKSGSILLWKKQISVHTTIF